MATKKGSKSIEFETEALKKVKAKFEGSTLPEKKAQPAKLSPKFQPEAAGVPRLVSSTEKSWDYTAAQVAGHELIITAVEEIETGYGRAFVATCDVDDQTVKVLIGAVVLVKTIDTLLAHGGIPKNGIATRIVKATGERYYIFE